MGAAKLGKCPKLLPCPFCGTAAKLHSVGGAAFAVNCPECGAGFAFDLVHRDHRTPKDAKAAAVAKWNRRALVAKCKVGKVVTRGWVCRSYPAAMCTSKSVCKQMRRTCRRVCVVEEV